MKISAHLELLSGSVYRSQRPHIELTAKSVAAAAAAMQEASSKLSADTCGEKRPTAIIASGTGRFDVEIADFDYYSDLVRAELAASFREIKKDSFDRLGGTLYLVFQVEGAPRELDQLAKKLA